MNRLTINAHEVQKGQVIRVPGIQGYTRVPHRVGYVTYHKELPNTARVIPAGPRVEIGFTDGSTVWIRPNDLVWVTVELSCDATRPGSVAHKILHRKKAKQAALLAEARKLIRCGTCKWKNQRGCCTNNAKIHEHDYDKRDSVDDHMTYEYHESGSFLVGDNFGCVHWEEKESPVNTP